MVVLWFLLALPFNFSFIILTYRLMIIKKRRLSVQAALVIAFKLHRLVIRAVW